MPESAATGPLKLHVQARLTTQPANREKGALTSHHPRTKQPGCDASMPERLWEFLDVGLGAAVCWYLVAIVGLG